MNRSRRRSPSAPHAGCGLVAPFLADALSRTTAELVRAAVEGEVVGFTVVSGISANRYRKAPYGSAERRLGFGPTDDAWASD